MESAMQTAGLDEVVAVFVNDDDADTWPAPGTHESFVADIATMGVMPTLAQ